VADEVRHLPAAALALVLLCAMAPAPPYVNPLTAEQLEGLRVSEIRFQHLRDGSIDAEKAAKAAGLVRARLIERLGGKFTPGNGNAVLVVPLQLVFRKGQSLELGMVELRITGKIVSANVSAEYAGARISGAAIMGQRLKSPEELLQTPATIASAELANQIVCCTTAALNLKK
jgi:hypothetical protein